jgi:hypothetical protein
MERDFKKTLTTGIIIFFGLFILVFVFFQFRNVIFGIKIENVNIVDGSTIKENPLNLTGVAKHAVFLSLNGREIVIDKDGNWNETIALLPGYNIIEIEAKDKFGNTDRKNYKLMYPVVTGE